MCRKQRRSPVKGRRRRSRHSVVSAVFIPVLLIQFFWAHWSFGEGFVERGEEYFLQGKFGQAREYLQRAQLESPGNPRVLSTLGRIQFHLGDYILAKDYLGKSLENDKGEKWIQCWTNVYLGKIEVLQGDLQGAGGRLSTVLEEYSHYTPGCAREARQFLAFIRVMEYRGNVDRQNEDSNCCTIYYNESDVELSSVEIDLLAKKFQDYFDKIVELLELDKKKLPGIAIYLHPRHHAEDLWKSREVVARYSSNEFHVTYENAGFTEHEMVHFLTADRVLNSNVSPVLVEGLAEYVVGKPWGRSLAKWVKFFQAGDHYVSLAELMNAQRFRRINQIVAYEEAGSFVKYLIAAYGLDDFYDLLGGNRTLDDITGKTVAGVEKEWLAAIDDIEFTDEEAKLFTYRLELGNHYHNTLSEHGNTLPRVGIVCRIRNNDVIIQSIEEKSIAQFIGLQVGDIIRSVQHVPVTGNNVWYIAKVVYDYLDKQTIILEVEGSAGKKIVTIPVGGEH